MASAADEKEDEFVDSYKGPRIEKRIEWQCPDKKRHDVVLFGSWDKFTQGHELEYQGQQTYAVVVALPLGDYVYRFLVDSEDWETSNATAKAVRDGYEYNTIRVREGADSDDDSDDDEEEEEDGDDNNEQNDGGKPANSQLIFDQKTKKFVVGKSTKKKRNIVDHQWNWI